MMSKVAYKKGDEIKETEFEGKVVHIPIYEVDLIISISDDPKTERLKFCHLFGGFDPLPSFDGLCSYGNGHDFGIFLEKSAPISTVSHEVFHLTHRILDAKGVKFDVDNEESAALLNGYLFDLIYKEYISARLV